MQKFIKATSSALIALSLGTVTFPILVSASANNTTQVESSNPVSSIKNVNDLTPYVKVQDNQFKLVIPTNVIVPSEIEDEAQTQIDEQNSIITQNHATIDPDTKTASLMINGSSHDFNILAKSKYHQGVNKVTLHWNYMRVYVKKSLANNIKSGALTTATAVAGAKIKNAYLIAGGAALSFLLDKIKINGGIYFDFNFVSLSIVKWGWQ